MKTAERPGAAESMGERIHYYSLRRVNPYLGVIQVVDVGAIRVYSGDGRSWQARRVYDGERHWSEEAAPPPLRQDVGRAEVRRALEERPPLPFGLGDRLELWLLDRESRLPLALLRTCRWRHDVDEVTDPAWRPFMAGESGFRSRPGGDTGSRGDWQERLRTLVNHAARPMPAAQWFERCADGSGLGLDGLHLEPEFPGRRLPATAFPSLLVREYWPDAADARLVCDFHHWHAALLLAHTNLAPDTRRQLEQAACRRPDRLLDSYLMLPSILDREAMTVAVVQARLMRSA